MKDQSSDSEDDSPRSSVKGSIGVDGTGLQANQVPVFNPDFSFFGQFNTKLVDYVYQDEVESYQFVEGKLVVEVNGLACS